MGMTYKERKGAAQKVCTEIDHFNSVFIKSLEKHVFDGFVEKLRECEKCRRDKENRQGPILLKLCGSLIDVRFMMETACEKLKLECVFAEERLNPLDLLKNSINSTATQLIHIQDNVSLNYLNRLLETFYTSDRQVFVIITVRSNDSNVIRLDPNLAASVRVESFIFDNPEPLFEKIINDILLNYALDSGLLLSGPLLKETKTSFHLEKQSFVELQNIVGMAIAKFGMNEQQGANRTSLVKKTLPAFKAYWISLKLFADFLEKGYLMSGKSSSMLDIHINIQSDEEWRDEAFERAKSCWKNTDKGLWSHFATSELEFARTFNKEYAEKFNSKEFLKKIEEFKELVDKTTFESTGEQMRKNLNKSPSQRKLPNTSQQTKDIFIALADIFSILRPFEECVIPKVQLVNCNEEEDSMDT